MMNIAVCILTYKRIDGLRKALQSLVSQKGADVIFTLNRIIVVDNEVNERTKLLCECMSGSTSLEITYVPEQRKGIAYARNTAIAASKDLADCIAFLDDDEEAAGDWLYELATAMEGSRAEVVTGNVIPILGPDTPEWVIKGRYFDRLVHRHFQKIDYARTGNVLMRAQVFERCGCFDEGFSTTGGEDTVFFNKAYALGVTIVWSSKAVVYETIERNRCTVEWIVTRTFRTMGTTVISSMMLCNNKMSTGLHYLLRGIARIGGALVIAPAVVFCGQPAAVKAMRMAARGLGMIMGVFGYHYKEYGEK